MTKILYQKKQISRPSGGLPRGGDHPGPSWAHQKRPEPNVELTKTYSETQKSNAFHTKTYSNFIIYRKAGGAPLNDVQHGFRAMSGKVQEHIGENQKHPNAKAELNI